MNASSKYCEERSLPSGGLQPRQVASVVSLAEKVPAATTICSCVTCRGGKRQEW